MELDQIVDRIPDFLLERTKKHFNLASIDEAKAKWRHALSKAGLEFARNCVTCGYGLAHDRAAGVLEELTGCNFSDSFETHDDWLFCDSDQDMASLLKKTFGLYPNIRKKVQMDIDISRREMFENLDRVFDHFLKTGEIQTIDWKSLDFDDNKP